MSSREIVTLQIGHYSNFVGSHWWNLQESSFVYDPSILTECPKEVNHDVLFREGRTQKGEVTFTPRLLLFDLNNSLGTLKKEGTLYDVEGEENIRWHEGVRRNERAYRLASTVPVVRQLKTDTGCVLLLLINCLFDKLGDVTLHQTPSVRKNKFLQDLDSDDEKLDVEEQLDDDDVRTFINNEADEDIDVTEQGSSSKSGQQVFGPRVYNLDNDVNVWSDFLSARLHPRSIYVIKDYLHNCPEQPFNIFGAGQQVCADKQQWDVMEDNIRYFVEECDLLQGFQILLDSHNAFGGLASSLLSYLSDEFSSKSRLSVALTPACPPDQTAEDRSVRILNSALSLFHCSEHSSLFVPMSLASGLWKSVASPVQIPHLQYHANLDYHTSAILAASLDTMTMPYRKETDAVNMSEITSTLSSLNRKVSALSISLPYPLRLGCSFAESLLGYGKVDPWVSLTPHVKCSSSPLFHSCVVRGVPSGMVKCDTRSSNLPRMLSSCVTVDDVISLYLSETYPGSYNTSCVMRDGLKVAAPYPHIFSPNVNYQGFLTDTLRSPLSGVDTVAAMTSLQSNADVFNYIDSLNSCVSRFNIARHQHFIEAGLEADDFVETLQGLKDLAQCYKANSDL